MHCTSYLPVCYSTRDRSVGSNGNTWPPDSSSDRSWNIGDGYNVLFQPYTTNQYLGYDMGVLKQTMLKHEATFRDQVQELHRLYRRQRELMDEIKRRELSKRHFQLQTSLSHPFLSQIPSESTQKMTSHNAPSFPWVNSAYSRLSVINTENFQVPLSFVGKSMQASSDYSLTKSGVKDSEFLVPKSKKFGKRMFDLELPAEQYIDSEEGEGIDDEKGSEVLEVPCYPLRKNSEILPQSDSFFMKTNNLVDLNEPILPEEAAILNPTNIVTGDNCLNSEKDVDLNFLPSICLPDAKVATENLSTINGEKELEDLSENTGIKKNDKYRVLGGGSAHDLTRNPGKCIAKDDLVVENGVDNKLLGVGNHIDLNSCINEEEFVAASSIPSALVKIDLEAPVSPENTECSPPRGVSEENLLENPIQLSKHEDGDLHRELATIAAEAIVSISSYGVHSYLENATGELSEATSGSLHWFAGIVSSTASNLKDEVETVLNGDKKELLLDQIDYFEAMTLNLTETKEEEYWCKSNGPKENETSPTLLSGQSRRGRARRARQRKDFQTELLPCIASLSRHEVTEDLQIIGGMMEAAGTPLETGLRRRNAGRGRKRVSISPNNVVECRMYSPLKQQNNGGQVFFVEAVFTGWGKKNRRQRGERRPARNTAYFLRE